MDWWKRVSEGRQEVRDWDDESDSSNASGNDVVSVACEKSAGE
jgi:hypothetical protein